MATEAINPVAIILDSHAAKMKLQRLVETGKEVYKKQRQPKNQRRPKRKGEKKK